MSGERRVWSSDGGRVCPTCNRPDSQCPGHRTKRTTKPEGKVLVARETKGRRGKGVTAIHNLALDASALTLLAKALKQRCGSGGTAKDGVIEIQGDHVDTLREELVKRGLL